MHRVLLFSLGVILLSSPIAVALEIEGITVIPAEVRPVRDTQFKAKITRLTAKQAVNPDGTAGNWGVTMGLTFFAYSAQEAADCGELLIEQRPENPGDPVTYKDGVGAGVVLTKEQWAAATKDKASIAALKNDLLREACENATKRYRPFGYHFVLRLVD